MTDDAPLRQELQKANVTIQRLIHTVDEVSRLNLTRLSGLEETSSRLAQVQADLRAAQHQNRLMERTVNHEKEKLKLVIETSNEKDRLLTDKVNTINRLEGLLDNKVVTEATLQLQAQFNENRAREAETLILTDDKAMCPLCNAYYGDASSTNAPRVLLCWHSICQHCINRLARGGAIVCNRCGYCTEMDSTGAVGLPSNVYILKKNT